MPAERHAAFLYCSIFSATVHENELQPVWIQGVDELVDDFSWHAPHMPADKAGQPRVPSPVQTMNFTTRQPGGPRNAGTLPNIAVHAQGAGR